MKHCLPVPAEQRGATVQRAGGGSAGTTQRLADAGVRGATSPLPHADRIARSFGPGFDVSNARARVGGAAAEASRAMGAEAFSTRGNFAAFASAPSLRVAAHEAAHIVQQRGGLTLPGGVGRAGDAHERHADAVAARVEQGRSAADLLRRYADPLPQSQPNPSAPATQALGGATGSPAVQMWQNLSKVPWLNGKWDSQMAKNGRLKWVRARNLQLAGAAKIGKATINPPFGVPPSWKQLQKWKLVHGSGAPNYVRMHMLNDRLGGPGSVDNLAPGSGRMNRRHYHWIEKPMINAINNGGIVLDYEAKPTYQWGSRWLQSPKGQAVWKDTMASLRCEVDYVPKKGGKLKRLVARIDETQGIDNQKNWKGH